MNTSARREKIQEMLVEAPDDPELRYCLAMEWANEGEMEEAVRCFADLEKRKPDYVPTYVQLGQLLAKLEREEEAKDAFRRGIAIANQVNDFHAAGEMEQFLDGLE